MKKVLFIGAILMMLVSCGGGSGSNSNSNTSITTNNGVAQKGPFSVGSEVLITQINSFGTPTGETIKSEVSSKNGNFSFETVNTEPNAFYRINVTGKAFNEDAGSVLDSPITLSSITNNLKNTSVNVLTHWVSQRIDSLLAEGKSLESSLDQSQKELTKIFGISDANSLDMTAESSSIDEDNAMLLLLSGALMEASAIYAINPQTAINEIGEDFADDGQLSEKGDDWFIRIQSIIKNNPKFHAKKYTKNLRDHLGYDVVSEKNLPTVIPLASRPVANLPSELLAEPGETIILDGSASNDGGDIINFTWFRVDQQAQYDIQVSDRFSPAPFITLPDEATVLAAPNQEISLLYALVVTDVDKLTHTGVVKVTVRIPPISNNPPVAESQSLITDEDTPINITLSASDVDGDQINYTLNTPLATPNGIVELDINLPNVIYTPSSDYSGSDSFSFLVNDGFVNSNSATIDILVNPINDPPIADAGSSQNITSEVTTISVPEYTANFTLDGSESTDAEDNDANLIFTWTFESGPIMLSDPDSVVNPQININQSSPIDGDYIFKLVVTDSGNLDSDPASFVTITVSPPQVLNTPPTANAGNAQSITSVATPFGSVDTEYTADFTLDGAGSTDAEDNDADLTFTWTFESGPITLSDPASEVNPQININELTPINGDYVFKLVVIDSGNLESDPASFVTIKVNPPQVLNTPPTANAGNTQSITSTATPFGSVDKQYTADFTLDGSGSTDAEDNDADLTFNWTFESGPITLSDPANIVSPQINITQLNQMIGGNYVFKLVVTDSGNLVSDPASFVTIVISSSQPAPISPIAFNRTVPIDDQSGFDTSIELLGQDPDGIDALLAYQIVSLPTTGRLKNVNGLEVKAGDEVTVNVSYESNSISSPDSDTFTYKVIDTQGLESNIAVVNLTGPFNPNPPVANAGFNRSVPIDEAAAVFSQTTTFKLDGTRSRDDEDASVDLLYQWTQISGPITFPPGTIPQVREPSFEITNTDSSQTLVGSYEFELQVTDTGGLVSEIDTVFINASLPNPDVIALPGEDREIIEQTTVQVVGSAIAPAGLDNSTRVFEWKQIDVIPGTEITLVFDPVFERYTPTFLAPSVTAATEIKLQLIVFDNEFGFSEPAVVTFTIFPTGTVIANEPPTAVDQNIEIRANGSSALFELRGMGDDPDGDNLGLTYEIVGFNDPGQGLNDPTQGSIRSQIIDFVYTPLYPVVENSVTYVAIDQDGASSAPATITFSPLVSPPGNTAPMAENLTINIDGPPTSSNSVVQLFFTDTNNPSLSLVQDADGDTFRIIVDENQTNDVDVRFNIRDNNRRLDIVNRVGTTAATGSFTYQAVDIYGNASSTVTITINYND